MKKILLALAAATLAVMAFAPAAGAAKTPTVTPATISLDQAGPIYYDSAVTFTVTYDPSIDRGSTRAEVEVVCTQTTTVVYDMSIETGVVFLLNGRYGTLNNGTGAWAGGAASCVAKLEQVYVNAGHIGQVKAVLATTAFNVLA